LADDEITWGGRGLTRCIQLRGRPHG
jgi:hypothetical protein